MIDEARFNRATLERMTSLRRKLRQATGESIPLAAPDALQRLLEASSTSSDESVRELGRQLAELLSPPSESEPVSAIGKGAIAARQYRPRSERPVEPTEAPAIRSVGVRIYRGQVIRG